MWAWVTQPEYQKHEEQSKKARRAFNHKSVPGRPLNQSSINGYLFQQPDLIFQGIKAFELPHYSTLKRLSRARPPEWPRMGAAWTSCCFITVIEELSTGGAPHTFSMDFHVIVQGVFRLKLLLTCITFKHLQIGTFFSDIFHWSHVQG